MSLGASRAALRRSQLILSRGSIRRATTASEAAGTAKEQASEATSKASQGLSRVASSAGSAISTAGSATNDAVARLSKRAGSIVGFANSLIPPMVHYSKVGLELAKLVFQSRQMNPPSLATFQSYMQPVMNMVRNPSTILQQGTAHANTVNPQHLLNQVRNMNREQMVAAGVVLAECLGFFTVGEMLGKFKIVGYRHAPEFDAHEHH